MEYCRKSSAAQRDADADLAKPLRPRVLPTTYSALTAKEIEERVTERRVELDIHKPERSAWLKEIFNQLRSEDSETRFFAMWRFEVFVLRMVQDKGHELSARFAAYALEHGILEEVIRIFKAAQSEGDFYIFPR